MKRFLALLLCLAMLASFAGCNEAPESAVTTQPTETTAPPTTQPEPTAAEVYAEAAEALRSREDVRMSVVYAREMKVGVDTLKETIQQDLTLRGIGTDAFCSKLEETWYNGSLGTLTNEVFKDGTMYCELNYDRFSAEMTGEEYLDRMLPAVLLDAALYETVEQEGNDFLFSGATELEEWVGGYYAWDISAEGTVKTDGKGNITESVYQAQYAQGTSEVTLKVTVKIKEDEGDAIEVPAKADTYILQDTPDGPGIVRRVIGYLLPADAVESNYLETATLEAAAVAGVTMMVLPLGSFGPMAGLLLVGLGCAPIYPCIIHSTPEHFGAENSQAIIGLQMASAYLGTLVMPPLFGLIANHISASLLPAYISGITVIMIVMCEKLNRKIL